jgi:tripartite ATP-independent transporter DctM subunit
MGKIALPEMKKFKYDDSLATGTIAASGTLGIMIPPSTVLIVYGMLVEESIGRLFVAGVLPGILLTILFIITVFIICLRNPELGPAAEPFSWKDKLKASSGVIEAAILFAVAIGGLFLGWFSPTQAGAIGAGGALTFGLLGRNFSWDGVVEAVKDGLRTSCMVLFIFYGAVVFGHFMTISSIPFLLVDWVGGLPIPPLAIMSIIILIFFLGGFFMDAMALIVVLVPIVFPLVIEMGFDPIWFGVIIVLVGEMGVITPPVGVNVFVIKGIAPDVSLVKIYRGIMPFLVALIILTIFLIIFPKFSLYLPSLVGR